MKSVLITGGAGFIGSNFIQYYLNKHPERRVLNLDKLTYAGDLRNLSQVESHPHYSFIQGDICDRTLLEQVFGDHRITDVIHFAAESHVDNSIHGPGAFINTNVQGTFTLLDVSRKFWMDKPFHFKKDFIQSRFLNISTDEVYGSLGPEGLFTEKTPYQPNSPYSASKASADLIARSYFHTFGLNIVTTNCSNNYGPHQHDEKLIPTIIRNALQEKPIPIYGDGLNIRDWLFVEDHCRGIDLAFENGVCGETYNIGGKNERTNLEIVTAITRILDELIPRANSLSYRDLVTFVADRPGHDRRYAIDATKIEKNLGWLAKETFETGIRKTVQWYVQKYER